MIRFLVGTFASFAAFFLAYYMEGGKPLDFLLPSPLMIVILVPVFAVLAVWSVKDWGRAWKDAFEAGRHSPSLADSSSLWDFYEKVCYAAGLFGVIAGFTIIFKNADLGQNMGAYAVAILPLVEGILLGIVGRILKARVDRNARGN